jgi:DNA-binding response OmpR family regulator
MIEQPTIKPLLIVDDDTELCALLTERLAEDGFIVHAVHDGREGLERAASDAYSLVTLDVMLPTRAACRCSRNYVPSPPFPC